MLKIVTVFLVNPLTSTFYTSRSGYLFCAYYIPSTILFWFIDAGFKLPLFHRDIISCFSYLQINKNKSKRTITAKTETRFKKFIKVYILGNKVQL